MGFNVLDTLSKLATESGFAGFFAAGGWQNLVMIVVACVLLYLGIVKGFEPLLLVGIAFGCLLANVSYFPGLDAINPDLNATNALYHPELWADFLDQGSQYYHSYGHILSNAGLLDIFYIGVKAGLYPSLIFMGVGAMTDFGPLIADPKSLLLGAAAQLGVFVAFFGAICLGFTGPQAASIGIIGGADGPTAIFLTNKLAPELLGAIAIAAYSYMALIPLIQPPIMKLLTSEEDRKIKMVQARVVSKSEKILFPIIVTIFVILLLPSTAPLVGCLMLGNLFRECGVHRPSVGHRAERPDEHRHHHALDLCRRDHGRFELPEDRDAEDHPARSDCLRHLHGRRSDRRQHHVQALRQEGQPPDRLRRRVRCPDGSARLADGRSEGEPRELPADARHGTQRRRCYRLGNRGRLPAGSVRLKISGRKGLAFSAGLFLKERKTFLSEKITPRRHA